MNNSSREVATMIMCAVIGGIAGYLFFTEHGRRMRQQIEPALEDFSRELMGLRDRVQEAAGAANEGWRLLNDTFGETGESSARYPGSQTSPF